MLAGDVDGKDRMPIIGSYAKLPASDVERARGFYKEHFGLEPHFEEGGHLRYDVAGTPLLLYPSTGSASGTHDQFGFVVDDLDAEVERLRGEGVRFETFPGPPGVTMRDGIMDNGLVKAGWFSDSEGNLISIAQFAGRPPSLAES